VILVHKRYLQLFDSRKKIAYFIRGNKSHKYSFGRSRILYIGRTERGGVRPFDSLKARAPDLLDEHGMRGLEVVYITGQPRQNVKIAQKLENACLWEFRCHFGQLPVGNKQGEQLQLTDEERYISLQRIRDILKELSR
jgi:hypothetical protein